MTFPTFTFFSLYFFLLHGFSLGQLAVPLLVEFTEVGCPLRVANIVPNLLPRKQGPGASDVVAAILDVLLTNGMSPVELRHGMSSELRLQLHILFEVGCHMLMQGNVR